MTLSHFQREHLAAHPGVTNRPVVAGGNAFIEPSTHAFRPFTT